MCGPYLSDERRSCQQLLRKGNDMITEYIAQQEIHNRERELAIRVERRRVAAERVVNEKFNGDRLALMAHVARQARAPRAVAHPAQ